MSAPSRLRSMEASRALCSKYQVHQTPVRAKCGHTTHMTDKERGICFECGAEQARQLHRQANAQKKNV
jgi:hypothetical protein